MTNNTVNTRFDTHICLVSGQPTPNLTPILSKDWQPQKVILVVSSAMTTRATWLKTVIERHNIQCDIRTIENAYDIFALRTWMDQLMGEFDNLDPNAVAVNLTGGTKPMSMAAQYACEKHHRPYFYLHDRDNTVQLILNSDLPNPDLSSKPLNIQMLLIDYLGAHGYKISTLPTNKPYQDSSEHIEEFFKELILYSGQYTEAIKNLNELSSLAEDKKAKKQTEKVPIDVPISRKLQSDTNLTHLLSYLEKAGLVKTKDDGQKKMLHFKNEDARFFCNGGWLEDYVYRIIRKLTLQDRRKNAIISDNTNDYRRGNNNELDIVFLFKNRLHLIECKTTNSVGRYAAANDILYKLDSLKSLGGLNTKGLLVSFQEPSAHTKKRAEHMNIDIVSNSNLYNLESKIIEWMER